LAIVYGNLALPGGVICVLSCVFGGLWDLLRPVALAPTRVQRTLTSAKAQSNLFSSSVPRGGGPGGSPRLIHPLPPGIPILPGHVRASGRGSRKRGLIILLVIAGLAALVWFKDWYDEYDGKRIKPAMTQAMFAHPAKGTRVPVKLWSGDRLLQIDFATVQYPPRVGLDQGPPTTCVSFHVIDPATGAKDPKYHGWEVTCIVGMAYRIH
jgi:hypothetical protein